MPEKKTVIDILADLERRVAGLERLAMAQAQLVRNLFMMDTECKHDFIEFAVGKICVLCNEFEPAPGEPGYSYTTNS